MKSVPVVLLDVNLQALKIIRSLGRKGIPVIGVVKEKGRWEQSTRYCKIEICPHTGTDELKLKDFLIELAGKLDAKPVLVPMQDDNVLFISKYRDQLSPHFRFLVAQPDVMHNLVSKNGLEELARQAGVHQPQTFAPQNLAEVQTLARRITYPALIKPAYSRSWQKPAIAAIVKGKVIQVHNAKELVTTYTRLAHFDDKLVIQEEIPGADKNLVYYVGYFDNDSKPLASFVGIKERLTPIHYGSASYVVSSYNQDVIRQSVRFMQHIGYKGHVGIEYKYDPRDNTYKLIEVNARFGLWDGMATLCGIDFPLLNYQYLQDKTVCTRDYYEEGVKWMSFQRDLEAFPDYYREKQLSFAGWLKSLVTGRRDYAVFAMDDPLPFIISSFILAVELTKRISRKLIAKLTPGVQLPS